MAICTVGEISCRRSVPSAKCSVDEMSCRRTVFSANCPVSELSCRRTVLSAICSVGEQSCRRTVLSANCLSAICSSANCPLAKCPCTHNRRCCYLHILSAQVELRWDSLLAQHRPVWRTFIYCVPGRTHRQCCPRRYVNTALGNYLKPHELISVAW